MGKALAEKIGDKIRCAKCNAFIRFANGPDIVPPYIHPESPVVEASVITVEFCSHLCALQAAEREE